MTHLFNLILVQVARARVWLPAGTSLFYVDVHPELLILVADVHADYGGRLSPGLHMSSTWLDSIVEITYIYIYIYINYIYIYCLSLKIVKLHRK